MAGTSEERVAGLSWLGRRVLVTGVEGFVASHLARRLVDEGALVYGTTRSRVRVVSTLDLLDIRRRIALFPCDLGDLRGYLDLISVEGVDTVFHLAAVSTRGSAARSPLLTIDTNVLGTANLLEVCRQTGIERVVVASSDKAYGDQRSSLPYREDAPLKGLHIYDCSKSCADLIAQTYYLQHHLPIRIVRCCNVYGPGDLHFSRLVPGTIARLLEDVPPVIYQGQAGVKREYIHVDDAVDAYLRVSESIPGSFSSWPIPETGDDGYSHCAYNVGVGDGGVRSTQEMVAMIEGFMQSRLQPEYKAGPWPAHAELPDQYLDSTRLQGEVGFMPGIGLQEGLRRAVEWYREYAPILRPVYEAELRGRR